MERLDNLLARRKLRLVEDAEADGSKDAKVTAALEGLSQQMATLSAQPKPQLRKIHVIGGYLDVLAALEDLSSSEVLAIPVGLTMKEAPVNATVHEWILLVWI